MQESDQIRRKLAAAASRGALHHALLLTGEGDLTETARYAAAAYECAAAGERPCLRCDHCRKVLSDVHPDVRFVRDDEHRFLSLELVREVRSDAYIIPNEGQRKVYVFEDCSRLDGRAQNILLKVVEEGPPYAAFLFLSESASAMLPTLRSRCVEMRVQTAAKPLSPSPLAEEFCRRVAEDKRQLIAFLLGLSAGKMKREELMALLEETRELLVRALLLKAGKGGEIAPDCVRAAAKRSDKILMKITELLRQRREDCDYNAGVGLLLGSLAAELEEIL